MWIFYGVKILLVSALGGCFIAQVRHQLEKFIRRDTTFTSTKRAVDSLRLPAVSLCARNGFKFDAMRDMGLDKSFWVYQKFGDAAFTDNKADMEAKWRNSTFDLSELVSNIRCRDENRDNIDYVIEPQDNDNITIKETNNISQGRCYTIVIKQRYEKKFQYMTIVFKANPLTVGAINFYLHDEGLEGTGLAWNYWAVQPYGLTLLPETTYNLELNMRKHVRDSKQVDCVEGGATNIDAFDCVLADIRNDSCVGCAFPYYTHVNPEAENVCKDTKAVRSTMSCIFKSIGKSRVDQCYDPCVLPEFKVRQRESYVPGKPQGKARLFIYYYSVEEEIVEEYVLFDFNAIVAAVGGSMGLFLGFSFLDCGFAVVKFVGEKYRPWKEKFCHGQSTRSNSIHVKEALKDTDK